MQEIVQMTGLILRSSPVGEYDRRVVLLTKERGKITAFARGARKPGSRLLAAGNLFVFGVFGLYPGRDAYTMTEARISRHFEELREDYEGAYYGMYFLELCDYYGRENNDERELLRLLYQSLRALSAKGLSHPLVRAVFELKLLMINGEFSAAPHEGRRQEATLRALRHIQETAIEKLYTFTVSEPVLAELQTIAQAGCRRCIDRKMKSLEMLSLLG